MAVFDREIASHTLAWEGGLVDHPLDPGGLTNKGIIISNWKRYAPIVLGIQGTEDSLKKITDEQALKIYKVVFWDKIKADQINDQAVAHIVFDAYVNMTSVAIPLLQFILNRHFNKSLAVDGIIGSKTLAAANSVDGKALHDLYKKARVYYYNYRADNYPLRDAYFDFFQSLGIRSRADQQVFLKGWVKRALSFADQKKNY